METSERREALAGVLNVALAHVEGKLAPAGDEGRGIGTVTLVELLIENRGKNVAQPGEAAGAGQLGNGIAELAAGSVRDGHLKELALELCNIDGHGVRIPVYNGNENWKVETENGRAAGRSVPLWEV